VDFRAALLLAVCLAGCPAPVPRCDGGVCPGDFPSHCTPRCAEGSCCAPKGGAFACVSGACPLPNLVVDAARAAASAGTEWVFFDRGNCAVVEGCVADAGPRRLLRFDFVVTNTGDADVYLGAPAPPDFMDALCHLHPHYTGFASFRLSRDGGAVLSASKTGGCFRDDEPLGKGHYACTEQGLSVGFTDVYGKELDCQWLDVTGLEAGVYTLQVEVNPDRKIAESTYADDSASFEVTIPP
jgi:hypothetical protein